MKYFALFPKQVNAKIYRSIQRRSEVLFFEHDTLTAFDYSLEYSAENVSQHCLGAKFPKTEFHLNELYLIILQCTINPPERLHVQFLLTERINISCRKIFLYIFHR